MSAMYIPEQYYWVKINNGWEICQATEITCFEGGIGFTIMGIEGAVYDIDDIKQSIHIPYPSGDTS